MCFEQEYLIWYIHYTNRFILTDQPIPTPKFLESLRGLLHPTDRLLLQEAGPDLQVEHFTLPKGTVYTENPSLDGHISMVQKGIVGVSHRMENLVNWSHFYTPGSFLFNLEIHKELNAMDSKWHVLEDTQVYSIDTNAEGTAAIERLMVALKLQRSLLCSYQYQHYINEHGLDRHDYSVKWLRSNSKVAAALPRKELANFLGVSNSSLKLYLKEALDHA